MLRSHKVNAPARTVAGRTLSAAVLAVFAAICAAGAVQTAPATTRPADRLAWKDRNGNLFWKKIYDEQMAAIAKGGGEFDFVLIGDSITRNWVTRGGKCYFGDVKDGGLIVDKEKFSRYKWLNLGIGGDGTAQLVWRCLDGRQLDGYRTRLFSLLIGTNNRRDSAEDVAAGIKRIVEIIREKHPEAKILVNAILPRFPREDDPGDMNAKNRKTNEIVKKFCDGEHVIWLDWGASLLKPDGTADERFYSDREHPAAPGYRVWADALLPHVREAVRTTQAAVRTGACATIKCGGGDVAIDGGTGAMGRMSRGDGRFVAYGFRNRYTFMSRGGDVDADELEDRVTSRSDCGEAHEYVCENPKMPGVEIVKRYEPYNGGVRRTLSFRMKSGGTGAVYVTPFTECSFAPSFQADAWHLGAGYIGPFKPFPKVLSPRPVNDYKQSSKGLVFVHPGSSAGGFTHFRVKIDDVVVLPWWHSTIGHYREYHDRLWYLPDGYRMGLGTFRIAPGGTVSVTDQFTAFDGDLFTFFDEIFAKDRDVAKEMASIPPPPKWLDDVFADVCGDNDDFYLRWMLDMADDGIIMAGGGIGLFSWGDYRAKNGFHGARGGFVTGQEAKERCDIIRAFSPRVKPWYYNIVISTSFFSGIYAEHPEWFRPNDREGNRDSLFPGLNLNWQTMFNHADCRAWIVDMLCRFADDMGNDIIYLDETQMTNTIDWERDCVTLDSDTVKFWKALKDRMSREGKLFFANGSGCPYADLNYMESPHELAPKRWRDWAGVGWGIGMMNRMRPGQRACPLYWTKNCDYANRVLALGWLPRPYYNPLYLPVMRAAYQSGNMLPVNARYTPDWKRDAEVEVESHSVKRADAKDVLISFISRAADKADVPVTIDLSTLGFGADERIAVWRMHLDSALAGKSNGEVHSDGELKRNWRDRGIVRYSRITDPELLYSGPASGTFSHTISGLGTDCMEQFAIVAAPATIFAENHLPINYPYTAQRRASIEGGKVRIDRSADILLIDREFDFDGVTVDGKPVKTRRIDVHGLAGTLVALEKGTWTLGWTRRPRDAKSAERPSLPVPLKYEKSAVPLPKLHFDDAGTEISETDIQRNGVRITRKATFHSRCESSYASQTNLVPYEVLADAERLVLVAGTSRKECRANELVAFSGFEIEGARQVRMKFTHTFLDAISHDFGHVTKYGPRKPENNFVGMMVDYSVGGKYVKRVSMSMGIYHTECHVAQPAWGAGRPPEERLDFGEWVDEKPGRVFSLDLSRFAPKGWDGRVFLSLGTARIQCGRSLRLDILSFNDAAAGDFIVPTGGDGKREMPPPLKSKPLKSKPKSLTALDPDEWKGWARIDGFFKYGFGRLRHDTKAYLAHDYEYLYLGVEVQDTKSAPTAGDSDVAKNDHVELFVLRPDKLVYQVLADPKGRTALYIQKKESTPPSRLVCRADTLPGAGWRLFLAVPIDDLKFDMQRTPVTIRADVCRVRKDVQTELSAWTPLEKGFYDIASFGTLILDFNWSGGK